MPLFPPLSFTNTKSKAPWFPFHWRLSRLDFQIFSLIDSSSFRKPVLPLISILEYRRLTFQSQLTLPPFTCGFLALTSTICLSHPEFLLASCLLSVLHSTNLRLTIWSRLIFVGSIIPWHSRSWASLIPPTLPIIYPVRPF